MTKYSRTVTLRCPTCTGTEFASEAGESSVLRCDGCGLELSRDDLERANAENLRANLDEVGEEAAAELQKQLHKSLADAFRGNKFIKFK